MRIIDSRQKRLRFDPLGRVVLPRVLPGSVGSMKRGSGCLSDLTHPASGAILYAKHVRRNPNLLTPLTYLHTGGHMNRVIVVFLILVFGMSLLSLACGSATPAASKVTSASTSVPPTSVPAVSATQVAKVVTTKATQQIVTPTSTATQGISPTSTAATPSGAKTATANANANLRAGPGTNFPIVGSAQTGAPLEIVARTSARDWYLLSSGAWIAAQLVDGTPDVPVTEGTPTPKTPSQSTVIPTSAPSQLSSFGDGMKIVGADIVAGTYRSPGGNGCYWERLKGFGGTLDEIAANANVNGATIVTIAATDKGFRSSRCNGWTTDLSPITSSPTAPFGDGTFLVNKDIAPGTWRSSGGAGCYWARLSGFSGQMDAILANANVNGSAIVTISPGDVGFSSARCGTWSKIQ